MFCGLGGKGTREKKEKKEKGKIEKKRNEPHSGQKWIGRDEKVRNTV